MRNYMVNPIINGKEAPGRRLFAQDLTTVAVRALHYYPEAWGFAVVDAWNERHVFIDREGVETNLNEILSLWRACGESALQEREEEADENAVEADHFRRQAIRARRREY